MMMAPQNISTIVLSAGGTGGHLFPAQALAQELNRRQWRTVLITDERGLKWRESFPNTDVYAVPSGTTEQAGWLNRIRAVILLTLGALKAWGLMRRKRPDLVIGFGGYPMLPALFAALMSGRVTAIHEQNGVMGRANRLVAPRVKAIALTFADPKFLRSADRFKAGITGNPVRDSVIEAGKQAYCAPQDKGPIHLLVFGGSQGARILSDVMPAALALLPEAITSRLAITQQCREEDLTRLREAYQQIGMTVELDSFFADLPRRMAESHLVICRSGASTVCELSVIGRPSILIPLPGALDGDQAANARVLVEAGGGWMIEEKGLTAESLAEHLCRLLSNPSDLVRSASAAKAQGRPNAVRALADMAERLKAGQSPFPHPETA